VAVSRLRAAADQNGWRQRPDDPRRAPEQRPNAVTAPGTVTTSRLPGAAGQSEAVGGVRGGTWSSGGAGSASCPHRGAKVAGPTGPGTVCPADDLGRRWLPATGR